MDVQIIEAYRLYKVSVYHDSPVMNADWAILTAIESRLLGFGVKGALLNNGACLLAIADELHNGKFRPEKFDRAQRWKLWCVIFSTNNEHLFSNMVRCGFLELFNEVSQVDCMIEYAAKKKHHDIVAVLMDYKAKKFGFDCERELL